MNHKQIVLLLTLGLAPAFSPAQQKPIEIHHELAPQASASRRVALTLDACSGQYDDDPIRFPIRSRIPATIFATKKWLDHNLFAVSVIKAHLDLFDVEDHGESRSCGDWRRQKGPWHPWRT